MGKIMVEDMTLGGEHHLLLPHLILMKQSLRVQKVTVWLCV